MKKFAPEMEIVRFHAEDVLTTSGLVSSTMYQWINVKNVGETDLVYWDGKNAYTWADYAGVAANEGLMAGDPSLTDPTGNGTGRKPDYLGSTQNKNPPEGWYHVATYGGKNHYTSCTDHSEHFSPVPPTAQ